MKTKANGHKTMEKEKPLGMKTMKHFSQQNLSECLKLADYVKHQQMFIRSKKKHENKNVHHEKNQWGLTGDINLNQWRLTGDKLKSVGANRAH